MANTSENDRSNLLSEEENQIVFTVIGQRKQTKATTVVQMFHAHPNPNQWHKFRTGVACFVKDNTLRSYYIRLIDISARKIIFEQELYDQFVYKADRPHFHSFPGDDFMVGLNFADPKEANKFKDAVESKIQYVQRATIRRSKPPDQNTRPKQELPPRAPPVVNRPPPTSNLSPNDPYKLGDNKKKPQAPVKGRKLTKADIGMPTDFKHLAHVGWDPNTGAFNSSNISPDWKNLLDKVGVTEEQLQDKDTAKFIYDFVEKNGGIQEANRQLEKQTRPPPPPPSHRGAPPPPPPSRGASRGPPPPPSRGPSGPPPPPPSSRGGGGGGTVPPPPPPPPPPPIGGPVPPPPPPSSGGGGGGRGGPPPPPPSNSKPSSSLPPVSDARGDLLASIRNPGFKLKKISDTPDPRASMAAPDEDPSMLDGMAGALQRALQQRAKVIQDESDDDDDDDEFEDDEEWES